MTVANIIWKPSVAAASTANVAGTFADVNLGVGDTITSTSGAALVVDTYTMVLGNRVLLKNQTAGLQNGVYTLTQAPVAGIISATTTIVQPTSGTLKNGTYLGVVLTGGSGSGAQATVVVAGNAVTGVYVSPPAGSGYTAGDVLTFNANGDGFGNGGTVTVGTVDTFGGGILTTTTFTQPTSGKVTNGTYGLFPLTGGTGTGAVGTITIAGGVVTSVVITNPGSGYATGALGFSGTINTPTQGLGTGGTVNVSAVTFTPWILTRSSDANFAQQIEAMAAFIGNGSQAQKAWVQNNLNVTLDTSALTFVELV
jgi:hypothetical protein